MTGGAQASVLAWFVGYLFAIRYFVPLLREVSMEQAEARSMVTGRVVAFDPANGTYQLPAEHAAALTRDASPGNLAVTCQWLPLLGSVAIYNRLVKLRTAAQGAWADVDVQLKRRHNLVANLVETVKGYASHEKDTLEKVVQARNQAVKIQADAMPTGGVKALAQAEATLTSALSRLNVVVEQYPDLKATANVGQLQEELTSTENRVAFSRQHYNDMATTYNVKQQQFPWNLITGLAKAETVELWEIEEPGDRDVPQVDLSMK